MPLDRMKAAELAVRKAAQNLDENIRRELYSPEGLSENGRAEIVQLCQKALETFKEASHE